MIILFNLMIIMEEKKTITCDSVIKIQFLQEIKKIHIYI